MIRWERQSDARQADMAKVKEYFTKLYRERLQYSKASKGQTRFNESANQIYGKPQARDEEDATAIMFVQMETRHQEQMENLQKATQAANERSMKMAENQMI